jgi:hypothetical protein
MMQRYVKAKTSAKGVSMLCVLRTISLAMTLIAMQGVDIAAAQPVKQLQITEKQVLAFLAAAKEIAVVSEKVDVLRLDKPDTKLQAELDSISQKHGFTSHAQYDDVAATISIIMAGIDPETKAFTEPRGAIMKEIANVTADTSMAEEEKKQVLEDLNGALKTAPFVTDPNNVELVRKHYDKIDTVLR